MSTEARPLLFLSDVHLSAARPDITEQFEHYLAERAPRASALYILGDLFEAWIGDDAAGAFERRIAGALSRLAATGTRIHFLHGNRDFLLGSEFCRLAGMRLLDQPHRIELAGEATLLLHGDTLCTMDVQYQRYRRRVSDPAWQRRMLSRPRWLRRGVAASLRGISRLRNRNGRQPYTDVADPAVIELFETSGARRIVHGHTHRPGRHEYDIGGTTCERIVLGDWYDQGSVLEADTRGLDLRALPRN